MKFKIKQRINYEKTNKKNMGEVSGNIWEY